MDVVTQQGRVVEDDTREPDDPEDRQQADLKGQKCVAPERADETEGDDRKHDQRLGVAAEREGKQRVDREHREDEITEENRCRTRLLLLVAAR